MFISWCCFVDRCKRRFGWYRLSRNSCVSCHIIAQTHRERLWKYPNNVHKRFRKVFLTKNLTKPRKLDGDGFSDWILPKSWSSVHRYRNQKGPKWENWQKTFLYNRGMIGVSRLLQRKSRYCPTWVTSSEHSELEFRGQNAGFRLSVSFMRSEKRPKWKNWVKIFLYNRGMVGMFSFLWKIRS